MAGNVWEWCSDRYDERYYASSPPSDPRGADSGKLRVLRGGSWFDTPKSLRASFRVRDLPVPEEPGGKYGFRCARDVP